MQNLFPDHSGLQTVTLVCTVFSYGLGLFGKKKKTRRRTRHLQPEFPIEAGPKFEPCRNNLFRRVDFQN
jgi:hypothetical protein